jgi:hypothetical protein
MLDADLAELYQVSTKVLNQAVKRNGDRFPADFMFQPAFDQFSALMSQVVFEAVCQLMVPVELKKRKIGFLVKEKLPHYEIDDRRAFRRFQSSENVAVTRVVLYIMNLEQLNRCMALNGASRLNRWNDWNARLLYIKFDVLLRWIS